MNIMQAYHELTRIAVATFGCPLDGGYVRDSKGRQVCEHKECGRYRTAVAAARMIYAMRSAAVR